MENSNENKPTPWSVLPAWAKVFTGLTAAATVLIGGYVIGFNMLVTNWNDAEDKLDKLTETVAKYPDRGDLITSDRAQVLVTEISTEVSKIVAANETKMAKTFDEKFSAFGKIQDDRFGKLSDSIYKIEETLLDHKRTLSDVSKMEKKMDSLEARLASLQNNSTPSRQPQPPQIITVSAPPPVIQAPIPGTSAVPQPVFQAKEHQENTIDWQAIEMPSKKKGLFSIFQKNP